MSNAATNAMSRRKKVARYANTCSVLPHAQHLTVVAVFVIIVHLVNRHAVGLCGDVAHLVALLGIVVHGALAVVATSVLCLSIGVEEDAKSGHAHPTEDTEDVALVLVEFGWCFATEDEEIVAEERLNACQAEVR